MSNKIDTGSEVGAGSSIKGYGDPRFYKLLQDMAETHSRKNQDYAQGGKQGHLGNFHRVSQFKQMYPGFDWTTPFGTAIDFMLKQLDAMMILVATNRKSITGEPVTERLKDVVIYGNIASVLWSEMEQQDERARKYINKCADDLYRTRPGPDKEED